MTNRTENSRWTRLWSNSLDRRISVRYKWEDGPEFKPSLISFSEIYVEHPNGSTQEIWRTIDMADERYSLICGEIYWFEFMQVLIPKVEQHAGYPGNAMVMEIHAFCPVCGCKRGTPTEGISWDGSRRLFVDTWTNDCGHIDKYSSIREEGRRLIEKTNK